MMNTIDDLYGVMEAIRPGTFGDFKKVFCARYYERQLKKIFVRGGGGATKRVWENIRPKNMDNLKAVLAPVTLRLPFAAFSAYLPVVQTRVVSVELMKQQRTLYTEILAKRLPTAHGMDRLAKVTALLYAQMCADAPLTVGARPDVNSAKQIELTRLLDEELRDRKVLVFSRFEQVVTLLCKDAAAAKVPHVRITGVENAAQRVTAQTAFQKADDPKAPRVCFLTTAGSEALNLHAADVVVFYDLPWTWGEFQQILGRARRLGSEHGSVLVLLLAALDTIDEVVLMNLLGKEHVTGSLALDDAKVIEQLVNTHQPDVQFTDVQTATSVASFVDSAIDAIFEAVCPERETSQA
jgi:SNF2 family DNA or RNA helicase